MRETIAFISGFCIFVGRPKLISLQQLPYNWLDCLILLVDNSCNRNYFLCPEIRAQLILLSSTEYVNEFFWREEVRFVQKHIEIQSR
jgi:hypothetical protein